MNKSNRVLFEKREEIINHETGEVQETKTSSFAKIEQEPNYIKIYLEDICLLNEIPKTNSGVLNELLKYTDYNNEILVPTGIKKRISTQLDIHPATIDNTLTLLVKKDILKRIDRGVYKLNPYLFGKGKWQDIKEIRVDWKYNENGKTMVTEVIKNEE